MVMYDARQAVTWVLLEGDAGMRYRQSRRRLRSRARVLPERLGRPLIAVMAKAHAGLNGTCAMPEVERAMGMM